MKRFLSLLFLALPLCSIYGQSVRDTLKNRLSYSIYNEYLDESFIHFYLLVGVGSIHENHEQGGMAHFVEHLSLGNTSTFENGKTALEFLNSIGIAFGKEVNATTFFDHTIYKIQLPISQKKYAPKILEIFKNILSITHLKKQDLVRQRNIITREYYTRNVDKRDVYLDLLTHNTKYWDRRNIIGQTKTFQKFTISQIMDFYNQYYTTSNAKIIVIGDIQTTQIEKNIQLTFDNLKYRPKKKNLYTLKKKFYFTTKKK